MDKYEKHARDLAVMAVVARRVLPERRQKLFASAYRTEKQAGILDTISEQWATGGPGVRAMMGALGGGLSIGLISFLLRKKKKRRALTDAIWGALLGGLVGYGSKALGDWFNKRKEGEDAGNKLKQPFSHENPVTQHSDAMSSPEVGKSGQFNTPQADIPQNEWSKPSAEGYGGASVPAEYLPKPAKPAKAAPTTKPTTQPATVSSANPVDTTKLAADASAPTIIKGLKVSAGTIPVIKVQSPIATWVNKAGQRKSNIKLRFFGAGNSDTIDTANLDAEAKLRWDKLKSDFINSQKKSGKAVYASKDGSPYVAIESRNDPALLSKMRTDVLSRLVTSQLPIRTDRKGDPVTGYIAEPAMTGRIVFMTPEEAKKEAAAVASKSGGNQIYPDKAVVPLSSPSSMDMRNIDASTAFTMIGLTPDGRPTVERWTPEGAGDLLGGNVRKALAEKIRQGNIQWITPFSASFKAADDGSLEFDRPDTSGKYDTKSADQGPWSAVINSLSQTPSAVVGDVSDIIQAGMDEGIFGAVKSVFTPLDKSMPAASGGLSLRHAPIDKAPYVTPMNVAATGGLLQAGRYALKRFMSGRQAKKQKVEDKSFRKNLANEIRHMRKFDFHPALSGVGAGKLLQLPDFGDPAKLDTLHRYLQVNKNRELLEATTPIRREQLRAAEIVLGKKYPHIPAVQEAVRSLHEVGKTWESIPRARIKTVLESGGGSDVKKPAEVQAPTKAPRTFWGTVASPLRALFHPIRNPAGAGATVAAGLLAYGQNERQKAREKARTQTRSSELEAMEPYRHSIQPKTQTTISPPQPPKPPNSATE